MTLYNDPWAAGVLSTRHLHRRGWSDRQIRNAVHSGDLRRLRQGWYALPTADPEVAQAVAAGGCCGCASALRRHGVWVLDRRWHVRAPERGLRRRPPTATVCHAPGSRLAIRQPVDDLRTALLTSSSCLPAEDFVAALDSVVNLGLMYPEEVQLLFGRSSRRVQQLVAKMDRAESGTESLARLRLRARGIAVRPQVVIPGVGRVDLLVGDSLVIEIDSVQHHTSAQAYQADRARDRRLRALGYAVIRVTYEQVVHDWESVEADIAAAMAHRDHRRRILAENVG